MMHAKQPWCRQAPTLTTLIALLLTVLAGCANAKTDWLQEGSKFLQSLDNNGGGELTMKEIGAGLKEALTVSAGNVVKQLGRDDGFYRDQAIHIPLPRDLQKTRKTLDRLGFRQEMDNLELKLNRAAEQATPKARELFMNAIRQMTFEDIKAIYKGPDDAATQYFRRTMSDSLATAMRPIVDQCLADVGALQLYDNFIGKYRTLPFVPDLRADLTGHVVNKGVDGIFHYIAKEEAAIRRDPAKRTTELLRRVFGR